MVVNRCRGIQRGGCAVLSVVIFLLLWHSAVALNIQRPLMFGNLPLPEDVWRALLGLLRKPLYYQHIGYSCLRIFIGCAFALPLGVLFGMLIGLSRWASCFLNPIFELLRPIPQITWIPVSILLFPTVEGSIIFITFIGGFFPILVNTIVGTGVVDRTLIDAAKSMRVSTFQMIRYVYFPSVVPHIFTGLTIGMGTTWMSVIAAEMI